MALTMTDCPNRKACDRCHTQKLSCKRFGDEPCERCVRLKTECKSSPSLRYRKQHSGLESLQAGLGGVEGGGRSPKRKRTGSGSHPVPPDFVNIQGGGGFASQGLSSVTHDPMLEMGDFTFGFDHSALFSLQQQPGDHLSQLHPVVVDRFTQGDASAVPISWSTQLPSASTVSTIGNASPAVPSAASDPAPVNRIPLSSTPTTSKTTAVVTATSRRAPPGGLASSDRVSKPRAKLKARQIILKSFGHSPGPPSETHWMPRLSEINSRLFELSSALPYQLEYVEHNKSHHGKGSNGKSRSSPFPVDEMFKLSRQFAEALQDVTSREAPRGGGSDAKGQRGKSLSSSTDPGSSMFILSTYVRLLDMYQKVFSCIHSKLPQLETENGLRHWKLPDVTVGSFAVESTPSLQMSLTLQLAEEFLSRLRGATAGLDPSSRAGSSSGGRSGADGSMFSGVVDVSFQAIKSREDSLGRQLSDLRRDLDAILDG